MPNYMNKIFLFLALFLFLFSVTFCQSANKTDKEQKEKEPPLNATVDEMDKIMFCSFLMDDGLDKYDYDIYKVEKRFRVAKNDRSIENKIAAEMLERCVNNVDMKTVNYYLKNFTFVNDFYWESGFDKLIKIDYDRYKTKEDIELTESEDKLYKKFEKINEIYKKRRREIEDMYDQENRRIRIGKLDLENIPSSLKLFIFIVIFSILFGGVIYLLKNMGKKPNDKKKKKKSQ